MEPEDRRDLLTYGLAIVSYIAIGFLTKKLLTWNLALLYFVIVLEVLPRAVRRIRRTHHPVGPPSTEEGTS